MTAPSQAHMPRPEIRRSSCLRTRFGGSSCSRCREVCPHNAISLEDDLRIDKSLCSGCQLCSAVCPAGALEPGVPLPAILKAVQCRTPIVIACRKAPQGGQLVTPCLGFISEEILLALFLAEAPGISLNLGGCGDCVNHHAVSRLGEKLDSLEARSGLPVGSRIRPAGSADELQHQGETCDRRSFFRSLTRSIVSEAVTLLSAAAVAEPDKAAAYAEKQLPLGRALLKAVLENRPPEEQERIMALVCGRLERGESCDGCRACTKVCPTGALLENYDETQPPFEFDAANCTACGLCVEFCLNRALQLSTA